MTRLFKNPTNDHAIGCIVFRNQNVQAGLTILTKIDLSACCRQLTNERKVQCIVEPIRVQWWLQLIDTGVSLIIHDVTWLDIDQQCIGGDQ